MKRCRQKVLLGAGMALIGWWGNSSLTAEAMMHEKKVQETSVVVIPEQRLLQQQTWRASWSKNRLTFQQTLSTISTRERSQPLTYRIVNQKGEVLQEQVAQLKSRSDDTVEASVTFDLSQLTNEAYLYLEVSYKGRLQKVKHQSESPAVFKAGKDFRLATKGGDLMLVNQTRAHETYQSHRYFAEQLHLTVEGSTSNQTYQLRQVGRSAEVGTLSGQLDDGIDLRFIEEGLYYIYLDQKPVYVTRAFSDAERVWHTVTRNGMAKRVELTMEAGMLALRVTALEQLPAEVYDILIDPGHGGNDPGAVGNGTTEAIEVLKVSTYIAKRLEDHGLKVKLTRSGMEEPATNQACNYDACPYVENGRIEQIYATRSNYVISNHLNASANRQSRGSEVYSSVKTSDRWSSQVISAFESIDRAINDVKASPSRVSTGSYKRAIENTKTDYYYMMRESGGLSTQGTSLQEMNSAYAKTPDYGAETILIEYAYLNHVADYQYWCQNWETLGELVVKATVQYLGIPYVSPALIEK